MENNQREKLKLQIQQRIAVLEDLLSSFPLRAWKQCQLRGFVSSAHHSYNSTVGINI